MRGGDLSLYMPYRLGVQVRVQIQYKTIYNSIYLTVGPFLPLGHKEGSAPGETVPFFANDPPSNNGS